MLVRDGTCVRGHWEGRGTFGVTDGVAVLWGCHRRRMAQGWLRWDGFELWAVPRCPRLTPGLLEATENSNSLFFGKAGSTGSRGEGMWIPRDADVRPDHGKESCGFSIPSCYTAPGASHLYFSQGNNPASVFIQTLPGMRVAIGRLLSSK